MCKNSAMPSPSSSSSVEPHRVVVLAVAPVIGYDLTIPPQVLGEAHDADGRPLYDVAVVTLDGRPGGGDPRLRHRPVGRPRGARHARRP